MCIYIYIYIYEYCDACNIIVIFTNGRLLALGSVIVVSALRQCLSRGHLGSRQALPQVLSVTSIVMRAAHGCFCASFIGEKALACLTTLGFSHKIKLKSALSKFDTSRVFSPIKPPPVQMCIAPCCMCRAASLG